MKNEIKVQQLKKIRNSLTALTIATSMLFSAGGCSANKDKKADNQVGFLVESDVPSDDDGLYFYVVNLEGLESEKYDFSVTIRPKNYAKIVEKKEYGTTFFNEMSMLFYRKNMRILWPSCFESYYPDYFGRGYFDCEIVYEDIEEYHGMKYTVVQSTITVKENLPSLDRQRPLCKGDQLSSTAIFYKNELVAYKQTGVGSDCQNIVDSLIGDVDLAISTVQELGILDESKKVTDHELHMQQEELNQYENRRELLDKY